MRRSIPIQAIDALRWAGGLINGAVAGLGLLMLFTGSPGVGFCVGILGFVNLLMVLRFVKTDSETELLQRELQKTQLQREIWETLEKNRDSFLREEEAKRDYARRKQSELDAPPT